MSLEEDLRDKALAIFSQQMANWAMDIQRQIGVHQGNLVRTLEDLSESVGRYGGKISEGEIGSAIAAVLAAQPPPPAPLPVGPSHEKVRQSIAEIEKGANLSEVLTYLVNEVAHYAERTVMLIVKGTTAIGWYAKGVEPTAAVTQINVPLNADTAFRTVQNSRHGLRGHISHSPGTAQALARLGGKPQGILAVPLILRDKLAAILYCDTQNEELPAAEAAVIEILVLFAAKSIDLLSLAPKPAAAHTSVGTTPERAAAIRGGEDVRERAGVPPAPPAPQPPPPPAMEAAGSSAEMVKAGAFPPVSKPAPAPTPPTPPRPAAPAIPPEEQKAHEDAKRFARVLVSEIKLYNEAQVAEGRKHKDLYKRLKEDIERGRQLYQKRIPAHVRDKTDYFADELVRTLAGGDTGALGPI
jgi:hypothetical protein